MLQFANSSSNNRKRLVEGTWPIVHGRVAINLDLNNVSELEDYDSSRYGNLPAYHQRTVGSVVHPATSSPESLTSIWRQFDMRERSAGIPVFYVGRPLYPLYFKDNEVKWARANSNIAQLKNTIIDNQIILYSESTFDRDLFADTLLNYLSATLNIVDPHDDERRRKTFQQLHALGFPSFVQRVYHQPWVIKGDKKKETFNIEGVGVAENFDASTDTHNWQYIEAKTTASNHEGGGALVTDKRVQVAVYANNIDKAATIKFENSSGYILSREHFEYVTTSLHEEEEEEEEEDVKAEDEEEEEKKESDVPRKRRRASSDDDDEHEDDGDGGQTLSRAARLRESLYAKFLEFTAQGERPGKFVRQKYLQSHDAIKAYLAAPPDERLVYELVKVYTRFLNNCVARAFPQLPIIPVTGVVEPPATKRKADTGGEETQPSKRTRGGSGNVIVITDDDDDEDDEEKEFDTETKMDIPAHHHHRRSVIVINDDDDGDEDFEIGTKRRVLVIEDEDEDESESESERSEDNEYGLFMDIDGMITKLEVFPSVPLIEHDNQVNEASFMACVEPLVSKYGLSLACLLVLYRWWSEHHATFEVPNAISYMMALELSMYTRGSELTAEDVRSLARQIEHISDEDEDEAQQVVQFLRAAPVNANFVRAAVSKHLLTVYSDEIEEARRQHTMIDHAMDKLRSLDVAAGETFMDLWHTHFGPDVPLPNVELRNKYKDQPFLFYTMQLLDMLDANLPPPPGSVPVDPKKDEWVDSVIAQMPEGAAQQRTYLANILKLHGVPSFLCLLKHHSFASPKLAVLVRYMEEIPLFDVSAEFVVGGYREILRAARVSTKDLDTAIRNGVNVEDVLWKHAHYLYNNKLGRDVTDPMLEMLFDFKLKRKEFATKYEAYDLSDAVIDAKIEDKMNEFVEMVYEVTDLEVESHAVNVDLGALVEKIFLMNQIHRHLKLITELMESKDDGEPLIAPVSKVGDWCAALTRAKVVPDKLTLFELYNPLDVAQRYLNIQRIVSKSQGQRMKHSTVKTVERLQEFYDGFEANLDNELWWIETLQELAVACDTVDPVCVYFAELLDQTYQVLNPSQSAVGDAELMPIDYLRLVDLINWIKASTVFEDSAAASVAEYPPEYVTGLISSLSSDAAALDWAAVRKKLTDLVMKVHLRWFLYYVHEHRIKSCDSALDANPFAALHIGVGHVQALAARYIAAEFYVRDFDESSEVRLEIARRRRIAKALGMYVTIRYLRHEPMVDAFIDEFVFGEMGKLLAEDDRGMADKFQERRFRDPGRVFYHRAIRKPLGEQARVDRSQADAALLLDEYVDETKEGADEEMLLRIQASMSANPGQETIALRESFANIAFAIYGVRNRALLCNHIMQRLNENVFKVFKKRRDEQNAVPRILEVQRAFDPDPDDDDKAPWSNESWASKLWESDFIRRVDVHYGVIFDHKNNPLPQGLEMIYRIEYDLQHFLRNRDWISVYRKFIPFKDSVEIVMDDAGNEIDRVKRRVTQYKKMSPWMVFMAIRRYFCTLVYLVYMFPFIVSGTDRESTREMLLKWLDFCDKYDMSFYFDPESQWVENDVTMKIWSNPPRNPFTDQFYKPVTIAEMLRRGQPMRTILDAFVETEILTKMPPNARLGKRYRWYMQFLYDQYNIPDRYLVPIADQDVNDTTLVRLKGLHRNPLWSEHIFFSSRCIDVEKVGSQNVHPLLVTLALQTISDYDAYLEAVREVMAFYGHNNLSIDMFAADNEIRVIQEEDVSAFTDIKYTKENSQKYLNTVLDGRIALMQGRKRKDHMHVLLKIIGAKYRRVILLLSSSKDEQTHVQVSELNEPGNTLLIYRSNDQKRIYFYVEEGVLDKHMFFFLVVNNDF